MVVGLDSLPFICFSVSWFVGNPAQHDEEDNNVMYNFCRYEGKGIIDIENRTAEIKSMRIKY